MSPSAILDIQDTIFPVARLWLILNILYIYPMFGIQEN